MVGSRTVKTFTIEVSTIGFISDTSSFSLECNLPKFSKELNKMLIKSVIESSFEFIAIEIHVDFSLTLI